MMSEPQSAIAQWIDKHVFELSTIGPDASLEADTGVVALGVGAHFIEEFWTVSFANDLFGFYMSSLISTS